MFEKVGLFKKAQVLALLYSERNLDANNAQERFTSVVSRHAINKNVYE